MGSQRVGYRWATGHVCICKKKINTNLKGKIKQNNKKSLFVRSWKGQRITRQRFSTALTKRMCGFHTFPCPGEDCLLHGLGYIPELNLAFLWVSELKVTLQPPKILPQPLRQEFCCRKISNSYFVLCNCKFVFHFPPCSLCWQPSLHMSCQHPQPPYLLTPPHPRILRLFLSQQLPKEGSNM